ncbi:TauD/TfdA family dioxygenase [Mycolicibacterium chubuense]|uniref:TauD/TfdA dioxygenase family protein n=1 Tax=Mycolicibacterium chubuense TaxID=1800 RepID=UPI0003100F21
MRASTGSIWPRGSIPRPPHRFAAALGTPTTAHPTVTFRGARVLFGHFVRQFVGLGHTESATLFGLFQARITKLENSIRWNWELGDLAVWDNRATQHYAVADYGDKFRRLTRVTPAGSRRLTLTAGTSPAPLPRPR